MPSRTMRAIAIDRFGGLEELRLRELPIPEIGPGEVLLRVSAAGVGSWDPFEREGGYARLLGLEPRFPHVLGSEGAGQVVAVGADVRGLAPGVRAYALGFLNPRGGFYAEWAAVSGELVAPVPAHLSVEQAAAMGGVGITALRGLEDVLAVRPGESVLIFGASGGIGHLAVQLARRRGARVLAVASGADGVALAGRLGAELAVDGRRQDVLEAARRFAPDGLDAALITAGSADLGRTLRALRGGGRAAFPLGVEPPPDAPDGIGVTPYAGDPDRDILERFHEAMSDGALTVHVGGRFALERAADAQRALAAHHLGKLVLQVAP